MGLCKKHFGQQYNNLKEDSSLLLSPRTIRRGSRHSCQGRKDFLIHHCTSRKCSLGSAKVEPTAKRSPHRPVGYFSLFNVPYREKEFPICPVPTNNALPSMLLTLHVEKRPSRSKYPLSNLAPLSECVTTRVVSPSESEASHRCVSLDTKATQQPGFSSSVVQRNRLNLHVHHVGRSVGRSDQKRRIRSKSLSSSLVTDYSRWNFGGLRRRRGIVLGLSLDVFDPPLFRPFILCDAILDEWRRALLASVIRNRITKYKPTQLKRDETGVMNSTHES